VSEYGQSGQSLSNSDALTIYGLFKQASVGDVNIGRPGIFDPKGRAKWDAWDSKKGISRDEAKAQYVQIAKSLLPPEWGQRIN
jgi:diazepam-binding inhibitor (GABA receptor modulator, acyl-CoA-binding protein)